MTDQRSLTELIARIETLERRANAHDLAIDTVLELTGTLWKRRASMESMAMALGEHLSLAVPSHDPETVALARQLLLQGVPTDGRA